MKKIIYAMCILLSASLLTACGVPQVREMTEEEEKLVTEYAAGLLLKYDPSVKSNLLDEEQLVKAEEEERIQREKDERAKQLADDYVEKQKIAEQEKKNKKDKNSEKDNNDQQTAKNETAVIPNDSVGEFLGLGVDVSVTGYSMAKSYVQEGNETFSVDASNGKELLIFNLKVANNSSEEQYLDMFSDNYKFDLKLNGDTEVQKCSSLLLNDFSIYRGNISAGANEDMILLFEVDAGTAVNEAQIAVGNGSDKGIVIVK